MFRKFIDWMKFNPPEALSWDGWEDFRAEFRAKAPVRFFLTKIVWKGIRRFFLRLPDIKGWVEYRTFYRFHIVKTGLEPGWYDVPEKMLYTNFTMLVDFVEQECAWMQIAFDKEARKKVLGWRAKAPRIFRRNFRSKELALDYLEWEMTLDSELIPEHERNVSQAERARKILKLYLWWTEERPKRKELEYPLDDRIGLKTLSARWQKENPEEKEKLDKWAREYHVLEEAWKAEDTAMLIELVKLRLHLWT